MLGRVIHPSWPFVQTFLKGQAQQLVQAMAVFKLSQQEGTLGAAYAAVPAANSPVADGRIPDRA